jgi:succinate dehydrogenase/fumarate reductase flavoprotein subunit
VCYEIKCVAIRLCLLINRLGGSVNELVQFGVSAGKMFACFVTGACGDDEPGRRV